VLTSLTHFIANDNQLNDSIPAELGTLNNLIHFEVDYNQLSGSIPPELGNLINLLWFEVDYNQLNGFIPPELGNLVNLVVFDVDGNELSGSIPAELGNFTDLVVFDVDSNELSGSIPAELGNLINLKRFEIYDNQISGSIPPETGNLVNLTLFAVSGNYLSGSIPPELGNLSDLTVFEIGYNQLSGSIPPELGSLINLTWFGISSNRLSGSIPPELGGLVNLTTFWISNNQLSGSIPPELGNLTNLQHLYLGGNQISGSIPEEISNLVGLQSDIEPNLILGYNKLTTNNTELIAFLNEKVPNWSATQTIAPAIITATQVTSTSVQLNWTPINYVQDGGYYEVGIAIGSEDNSYIIHGLTNSKSDHSYLIDSLIPNTTYRIAIRTYTPAHSNNQNALWSDFSTPVTASTASAPIETINIYALALDNNPTDTCNLAGEYPEVQQTIAQATAGYPGKVAVILADLDGPQDTHIFIAQNGELIPVTGLPDENGNLTTAIDEYDMSDGAALGGFLKWVRDTFDPDRTPGNYRKTVFSYIGHGLPLTPKANLEEIFGSGIGSNQALTTDGIPFVPGFKGVHPCWTDQHPQSLITPYDLAQALEIATENGAVPITIMDITHCFAATIEEFYELSNPGGAPYAEILIGSPNYTYFAPSLLRATLGATDVNASTQQLATNLVNAYDAALAAADIEGGNDPSDVDHPRILVAVNGSQLAGVKNAFDLLAEALWNNFDRDAIRAAYETSNQKYDTTYCYEDWLLDTGDPAQNRPGDSVTDITVFMEALGNQIPSVEASTTAVINQVNQSVIYQIARNGTPWFAATHPDWILEGANVSGIGLYTDFHGVTNGSGQIPLGFQAPWYGNNSTSESHQVFQFLEPANSSTGVTWADIFNRFWDTTTENPVAEAACLPALPPVQYDGEVSFDDTDPLLFPINQRGMLSVGVPVTPSAAIKVAHITPNVLVTFEVNNPTGELVYWNTVSSGYWPTGTHKIDASAPFTPTSSGLYTFTVILDPDNRIVEPNEGTDNKYSEVQEVVEEFSRRSISVSPLPTQFITSSTITFSTSIALPDGTPDNNYCAYAQIYQYRSGGPNQEIARRLAETPCIKPTEPLTVSLANLQPGAVELHIWGEEGANSTVAPVIVRFNYVPVDATIDPGQTHYYLFETNKCDEFRASVAISSGGPQEDVDIFAWSPFNYGEPIYYASTIDASNNIANATLPIVPTPFTGEYVLGVMGTGDEQTDYVLTPLLQEGSCANNSDLAISSSLRTELAINSVNALNSAHLPNIRPNFLAPVPRTPSITDIYLPIVFRQSP
jgi:Leucine-rich repeat (LRR) protein